MTGQQIRNSLSGLVKTVLQAGTSSYSHDERSNLVIVNIVGYLATLSSLNYAATYAAYDFSNLKPLVYGNLISATLTASCPLWHRFGRLAAVFFLTAVIYASIYYFMSLLGRQSGIQLNYLGAAAVVLVVCGQRYMFFTILTIITAAILHLMAWHTYRHPRADIVMEDWFLDSLYVFSTISIMAIIFIVVFYAFQLVRKAQSETDALLHNIMPDQIVERLKQDPDKTIADQYESASVLFADLTGFTALTNSLGPTKTVAVLDDLFTRMDALAKKHNVEKIKTIGDAYMAVAGIPLPDADHRQNITHMARDFLQMVETVNHAHNVSFNLRIGIASGPVMAGIIGKSKYAYDVWGETVNRAARIEPRGKPGTILVDQATHEALKDTISFNPPIALDLKGLGKITAWELGSVS